MNLLTCGPAKGGTPQIMKVMKLTFILITVAMVHVSARGVSQTVTFSGKDISLEKIFTEIKKQTGYVFFYDASLLRESKPVTLDLKNVTLENALEKIFYDQPLTWQMVNKTITIVKKSATVSPPADILQDFFPPPPIDIHGRVTNEAGDPIEGVTVTVKGTKIATATNANGEFTLKGIDEKATLVFTGVNIETSEMKVNGQSELAVSVKNKVTNLEDVVVSKGYYSTTQRLNTGDVTKVTGETINKQPVSDPILALEGRVSGLYISQASGIPGSGLIVRLRGQNSIANGNNPFYVVDGVPFTNSSITSVNIGGGAIGSPSNGAGQGMSPFNSLNPSDIESIEILKDADATAIYGSRGANGVILITTKKGKAGKTKFDINVNTGAGNVSHMLDLLNTQEYLAMRHEAYKNDGVTILPANAYDLNGKWDTTRYTNWQKVLIGGTAKFTNIQSTLSGGNETTQFLIGCSYSKQTTVLPGDYRDQKGSVHFNLNHVSPDQKFHAIFSATYVNDNSNLPKTDFTSRISLAPDAPALYDAYGNLNWQNNTFNNPLSSLLSVAKAVTDNLNSNLNLNYELFRGLQVKCDFGYSHIQMNQSIQTFGGYYGLPIFTTDRENDFATNDIKTWIIEPQVSYTKRLGHGLLNVLAGETFQQNIQSSVSQRAIGFSSDALIPNIAAASTIKIAGNNYAQYRYNAIFGRINYNWEEKYLINLTARRDGSSRFGPGKQFGNFGAIGTGWIFAKEKFIKKILPLLSFGKLRGSYGITGNDQLTDYQYLSTYSSLSTSYQGVAGLIPSRLANGDFGWEVVKKFEGGLELGFLKDRILLTTNYYRNRTGNQLVGYALPSISGFTTVQANLPAIIQNTGLEFELNTFNIRNRSFTWNSSINLSIPCNKLVAYPNLEGSSYKNSLVIGQSIYSAQKYYHYTGVNPSTGLYTVEDFNMDGTISSPQDNYVFKQMTQSYFGGFQNNFTYKGFQLDIFFQFVKQTGNNYLRLFPSVPGFVNQNEPTYILSRWQNPGDNTDIERFSTGIGPADPARSNYLSSDANVVDASFIRLKNVSLSYTLPGSWQQKLHIQNARIYLQGQNIFTITKYKGLDPETQSLSLPPLKMITAGLLLAL